MSSKIFVVATPIGNLEDITFRAIRILKTVHLILAEDTRVTKKLLDYYDIKTPLISYHAHSRLKKTEFIKSKLKEGRNLALVSDAGTPSISDPGSRLINYLAGGLGGKLKVVPIPGPSALTATLSVAGADVSRFVFLGFPPAKKKRKKFFENLAGCEMSVLLFESPHRIRKTLENIREFSGERKIVVMRELTKQFETIYRGKAKEILGQIKPKGEFVIIIQNEK